LNVILFTRVKKTNTHVSKLEEILSNLSKSTKSPKDGMKKGPLKDAGKEITKKRSE